LPHNPLICERELFEYYLERLPVPETTRDDDPAKSHPALRAWRKRRGVDSLTPEQCHRARAAYYALVTQMDRNVGRIVETVRNAPGGDDTVIVYCSDHGDMAGEHGLWWKSNFFEGSVGVPLIASCPKHFARGRTVDAVVNLTDVGPTLLDLAGAPPMVEAGGRSLAGFLTDAPPGDWPNETYAEYVGAHGDRPSCMLRSGPWKMMYYQEFDAFLLFHLDEDPGETRDRADDPACAEVAARLLAKVRARFSPERMLEGAACQGDRWLAMADHSNECDAPHPVRHETPPAEANAFDFSQVPGRERIRTRFETGTAARRLEL
jgi:choline-sulfatase